MPDLWTWYRVSPQKGAATELVSLLAEHGLVLFDGVNNPDELLQLARSIAAVVPHRDSDAAGITTIADVGGELRSGFAGFSACALDPHTDRSGIANPPALLMMSCGRPASSGGECVAVDGKLIYDDLAETSPEAIEALSSPRSVLFGGAAGHLGSIFSRIGDRIVIRLRLTTVPGSRRKLRAGYPFFARRLIGTPSCSSLMPARVTSSTTIVGCTADAHSRGSA